VKKKSQAVILLSLLLFTSMAASNKGWRGIIPLHSTCNNVKKALKVNKCSLPMSEYNLPDFRVVVFFSEDDRCEDPRGWRVPQGTITSLVVSPTKEMCPSEFGINISNYKKLPDRDVVGMEGYDNDKEGVTVNLFNGYVQNIIFYPPTAEENLRCKPSY
jgi:hypothetical protein